MQFPTNLLRTLDRSKIFSTMLCLRHLYQLIKLKLNLSHMCFSRKTKRNKTKQKKHVKWMFIIIEIMVKQKTWEKQRVNQKPGKCIYTMHFNPINNVFREKIFHH